MASSLFGTTKKSPVSHPNPSNNTMEILLNAARAGKRPQDVLPKLAKSDPTVMQAMQIISGNTPAAVTGIIQQMAAKQGFTIPNLMARLGIK